MKDKPAISITLEADSIELMLSPEKLPEIGTEILITNLSKKSVLIGQNDKSTKRTIELKDNESYKERYGTKVKKEKACE